MKGPFRNKQGSSLVEIVVAIAILGLMVAPVCSSLVLSHRLNAESEKVLQARLLVEATVEQLMAEGISFKKDEFGKFERNDKTGYVLTNELEPSVNVTAGLDPKQVLDEEGNPTGEEYTDQLWYDVVVEVDGVENVRVVTVIKAAPTPGDVLGDADAPPKESEG